MKSSLKEANQYLKELIGSLNSECVVHKKRIVELESLIDPKWIEYAKRCISEIESQNKKSDDEYRADKAGYG